MAANETIDKLKDFGYITVTADSQGIADQCQISDFPYKFIQLPDIEYTVETGDTIIFTENVLPNKLVDKAFNETLLYNFCIQNVESYINNKYNVNEKIMSVGTIVQGNMGGTFILELNSTTNQLRGRKAGNPSDDSVIGKTGKVINNILILK